MKGQNEYLQSYIHEQKVRIQENLKKEQDKYDDLKKKFDLLELELSNQKEIFTLMKVILNRMIVIIRFI